MVLIPTALPGVLVIELAPLVDDRGFLAVSFSRTFFAEHGLNPHVEQVNLSYNAAKGTLRGMHYQQSPFQEAKTVRCVRGAAFDVAVDLRPDSPTYCQWFGAELSPENRRALYVPEGVAHGFQTLTEHTEVVYTVSAPYTPSHGAGVRWDDPVFRIDWPDAAHRTIHPRDRTYPAFVPVAHAARIAGRPVAEEK
ncbi:MAG TPA: dTDP-4-dehydrorhamnose 3,5-epimerase [Vicinamibacterales bacterium]|nr:dTDP-4-dehydrorhamnose 3,5-epimerase [Vicinamibacterales bacterium]